MNSPNTVDASAQVIDTVVSRSRDLLFRIADGIQAPQTYSSPFLGQGSVLNSIVLTEAGELRARDEDIVAAAQHLRHGMQMLDAMPLSSSLYRGITGFGWAVQTFPKPEFFPERDELLCDLDELLADGVEVTRNPNIDLINGLAGIAVYALSRGNQEASSKGLWSALDQAFCDYLRGWSPGAHYPEKSAANNLGVAHGVPGLLAVGAVACAKGWMSESAMRTISAGFETLWSNARRQDGHFCYPVYDSAPKRARLAWCYGSLGIAAAFRHAIALDAANAERFESMVASSLQQYASGDHGIRDASLCHGEAGVALSLEYLAQGSSLSSEIRGAVREQSLRASRIALDSERRDMGEGAYLHSTAEGMKVLPSFLEGGAGVALAIVSAYAERPRPWMALLGYY
jgi:Lanthionine synthetase C-like protein